MSALEERALAASDMATGLMETLIERCGTNGDYAEGNRQWNVIYRLCLKVVDIQKQAEREVNDELDRLASQGPFDRDAVLALANIYVERGQSAKDALAEAANRLGCTG